MTQASIEALAALHVGKELLRIRRGAERDGLPDIARRRVRAGLARHAAARLVRPGMRGAPRTRSPASPPRSRATPN